MRPWSVGAVVAATTAFAVLSLTCDDAGGTTTAAPRSTGVIAVLAHDGVTAARTPAGTADGHPATTGRADDDAVPLNRADSAWQRRLTAEAEAWLRAQSTETAEYRAAVRAFLDTLPGGATATIEWGDPDGHLGGVWIPGSETIILHATRLDGDLTRTQDVVRHEIGHIHQNRAMAAAGMPLAEFEARLDQIFDGGGIERSADAIALILGAGSVRYANEFTDAQYDAARALLDDRVP